MTKTEKLTADPKKLIPVQSWADSMGLSVWTARRMAYEGKIASVKLGKLLMIPAGEAERIISERLRPAIAA